MKIAHLADKGMDDSLEMESIYFERMAISSVNGFEESLREYSDVWSGI